MNADLGAITAQLKARGEKALVPFFTAGYPDEPTFLALVKTASDAGCPLVEIGIPFSDPIADGPVIQASSEKALAAGMTLRRVLDLAGEAGRTARCGLVLMGYLNPIHRFGIAEFAARARETGVCGAIIPDVPLEESSAIRGALAERGVMLVDFVALTSPEKRIAAITAAARGFIYLVAVTGVTGSTGARTADLGAFAGRVRRHTGLPLYAGFGISGREQARAAAEHADGVIIGSAIIRIIEASAGPDDAVARTGAFLWDIQQAINPALRSRTA